MGDLLTFAIRPGAQVSGVPGRHPGPGPDRRFGLRRGTRATAWYDAGCRLEAADPEAASVAYERALAGNPGLADAYNNLGRLFHDAADRAAGDAGPRVAAAESHYRLAICADPNVALYWFNLGVAVEDQGRHAEAIAAYEQAIERDPAAADAYFNLARLLELKARRAGDDIMLRRAVRHLLRYRDLTRRSANAR